MSFWPGWGLTKNMRSMKSWRNKFLPGSLCRSISKSLSINRNYSPNTRDRMWLSTLNLSSCRKSPVTASSQETTPPAPPKSKNPATPKRTNSATDTSSPWQPTLFPNSGFKKRTRTLKTHLEARHPNTIRTHLRSKYFSSMCIRMTRSRRSKEWL